MSDSKFNVIFMRDNSPVRRYRVSPAIIKFAAYGLVLLVLLACGGVAAGYNFWRDNAALRQDKNSLERQLREANMELERLQNVDKILKSNDPEELQTLLGSMSPPSERKGKKEEGKPSAPTPPPVDLKKLFDRVDTRQASVENFTARLNGDNMILSFSLNNLLGSEMLTGAAQVSLILVDGALVPVTVKEADMTFQIQRFKQITTTFALPKDVASDRLFGLRLMLKNPQGQTIFSETLPIPRS
ncbi:MAG: hypothetical protein AB1916_04580 [Thermodesulfobacteriota bacterium]